MNNLSDMVWIEMRKAIRSKMPLWTALGSFFMPFGIAFLIFVSKNPEISKNLGLISAKANLLAFSTADWATYMGLYGQLIAAGGFILFILIISWIFGREYIDGTLKDLLAIPIKRQSILLAKFAVTTVWCAGLTLVIYIFGIILGALLKLPGGSTGVIFQGSVTIFITAGLVILVVMPFALFASIGQGYLLPIGIAVLTLMMANVVVIVGWGEYYPWAVPGLYAQGKTVLSPNSYLILFLTCMVGMSATYLWWKYADQNK